VLILSEHEDAIRCLSYSPDGKTLASDGEDHTVRLWDLGAGGMLGATLQHSASVETLAFTPDGKKLVTGTARGALFVWELARKRSGMTEQAHTGGVRCLAPIADGKSLVTCFPPAPPARRPAFPSQRGPAHPRMDVKKEKKRFTTNHTKHTKKEKRILFPLLSFFV
jgi:WD40 repeat protein